MNTPENDPIFRFNNLRETWKNLPIGRKLQIAGAGILGATCGADVATTYLGFEYFPYSFYEINPLMRHLFDNFGVLAPAIGMKVAAIGGMAALSEAGRFIEKRFYPKKFGGFLLANIIIYEGSLFTAATAVNNFYLLLSNK